MACPAIEVKEAARVHIEAFKELRKQNNKNNYATVDLIPKFEGLSTFVPNVEEVTIDCGHWIQQEKPEETNQAILSWLQKK